MPSQVTVADILEARRQQSPEVLDQRKQDQQFALRSQQISSIEKSIHDTFSGLIRYLDGQVTKTQVVNQLTSIGTPDALKVIPVLESLHETLKTHQNTDLSGVTSVMEQLLAEAKQIPKELPKAQEVNIPDYSKQFSGLVEAINSVEKVVKAQKLVAEAPIVNVPEPNVHIQAPDLSVIAQGQKEIVAAVKKIVIPEQDNSGVEKLLKKLDKSLNDLPDQMPVSSGGGGGGIASYKNTAGNVDQVQLDSFGAVPVQDTAYAAQIDTVDPITYIGKASPGTLTSAASWQIKKIDSTSGTSIKFASGNSNFNKVWDDRASLSYS